MTVLLDLPVARTLDVLLARLSADQPQGHVEAWLFEDQATRRAAETRLAAAGVSATIRSAYKPLLHFFLEETDVASLRHVTVRYPHHQQSHPDRFLAETYPLAPLLGDIPLSLVGGDEGLSYAVELTRTDGTHTNHHVFAPNHLQGGTLANCS